MEAHGAVVSLCRTLDTVLYSSGRLPIYFKRHQLESLRDKINFLQKFLENPRAKTSNDVGSIETKIRVAALEAENLILPYTLNLPEPGNEGRQDQNPLRESLFFAVINVVVCVLVQNLCNFAVKKLLPVGVHNLMLLGIQILTAIAIILNSPPFLVKHVIQVLTKIILSVQDNSYPENQGLRRVIEDVGFIVNKAIKIWAAYGTQNRFFAIYVMILVLVRKAISLAVHVCNQKVMALTVQFLKPFINVIKIQTPMPVSFQNVIFVPTQILIPFMVKIYIPVLILSLISDVVTYLIHEAVLHGISLVAPYEDQNLTVQHVISMAQHEYEWCQILDDFSSITKDLSKIKDVSGLRQDLPKGNTSSTVKNVVAGLHSDLAEIKTRLPSDSSQIEIVPVVGMTVQNALSNVKNGVVGLDNDLAEIKTQLTSDSSQIKVVPIVGMGGIGKTTLARQVYNDSYFGHHFDIRAWVTISQEYSLRQVLVGLLDSAKMLTENMYEKREEQLAVYLYKCLKDRRYLMVMDDVWDTEIWDAVRRSFPEDKNRSRVVLTTRLSEVALYANSGSPLHRMRFLNQDESWTLLWSKVFGETDCPRELEPIGKEIAGNCGGLPLAIAVIGGLLSKGSRTKHYWRSIADNLNSVVTKDDDECMEILSLSYKHLPLRLRPCFLYMGAFPEDYEIPLCKLIRLWAAEGFLEPHGLKSMEELAEEYLGDLVERNLVLVCKKSATGKIKTCNIHDLLRTLCMRYGQKENFLYVVKCEDDILEEGTNTPNRISIHPNFLSIQSESLYKRKIYKSSTRSLLCTGARLIYPSRVYLAFVLLRVLDLIIVRFFHFPDQIITLVNLRYLAFTYNEALPPSISQLQNLETLIHHNWTYRQCPFLPYEIFMMPKLRHLCITPSFLHDPSCAPVLEDDSCLLENLQTLLEVRNLRCSNDILKRMPYLKTLEISYDVSPSEVWSEYQLDCLVDLHQLETLKLVIKNSYRKEIVNSPKLALPQNLKRLTLSGCCISWSNMTIVGALPNLEVLKLRSNACRGSEWEPVEEEFCQLKYLLLDELDLEQWVANESHFPRLQRLIIRSCYKLKEIPSDIGEIKTLEMIELVDCHSSAVTSARKIEEEQQSFGNEDLRVNVDLRRRFKNKFYSRVLH